MSASQKLVITMKSEVRAVASERCYVETEKASLLRRAQASEDGRLRVNSEAEEHNVDAVTEDGIKIEHNVYETETLHVEERLQIGPTVLQRNPPTAKPTSPEVTLEPRSPEGETSQEDLTSVCPSPATAVPPAGPKLTIREPVTCNICERNFYCSSNLNAHMHVHTGEKPFHCTRCNAKFAHSSRLKQHLRIHTGERSFICTRCNAKFAHSGDLKSHMRMHTGEKPFSCTTCDAKFAQSGNLKWHMRIHTGKSFSCTTSDAKFSRMGNLKKHVRLHTGEKPLSCTECDAEFTELGVLHSHMRMHTGAKLFSCITCNAKFIQLSSLNSHMLKH